MTYPHPENYHEAAGSNPCGEWHYVHNVTYHIHKKKTANAAGDGDYVEPPRTMKVIYHCNKDICEWVCLEHPVGGFARRKANAWWIERGGEPLPPTLELAVEWADKSLKKPSRIFVEPDGKFSRITDYDWSVPVDEMPEFDPDDVPF